MYPLQQDEEAVTDVVTGRGSGPRDEGTIGLAVASALQLSADNEVEVTRTPVVDQEGNHIEHLKQLR